MVDTQCVGNVTGTNPVPVRVVDKGDAFFKHLPFCMAVKGCGHDFYVRKGHENDDLGQLLKKAPFPEPTEVDCVIWKVYTVEEQAEMDALRKSPTLNSEPVTN